jgi:signal transduction histidine kinase
MLLELALRDRAIPEKFTGHVRRGLSAARQMLKSLDETVWAINPRNDTLPHLVNYIAKFAIRFLDSGAVRCRLDLPEHPPELNMPADVRHNLFLVVKEAVNNIVRHGHASEAWLRVSVAEEALKITIEDNGCGFERPPEDPDADGLRNMRQRMNDMGGSFAIESVPGSGTRVNFVLPWPNQQPPVSHIRAIARSKTPAIK